MTTPHRLSPAARRSIRRMMRRRPGAAHGNPLPPLKGTRAFWVREDSRGGWRAEGPAIWARFPRTGEIRLSVAPLARSPSAAIVVATRRRGRTCDNDGVSVKHGEFYAR